MFVRTNPPTSVNFLLTFMFGASKNVALWGGILRGAKYSVWQYAGGGENRSYLKIRGGVRTIAVIWGWRSWNFWVEPNPPLPLPPTERPGPVKYQKIVVWGGLLKVKCVGGGRNSSGGAGGSIIDLPRNLLEMFKTLCFAPPPTPVSKIPVGEVFGKR